MQHSKELKELEPAVASSYFFGTYPSTVQELTRAQGIDALFASGVPNDEKSGTLCLEHGKTKLMLAYAKGRRLQDMEEGL
jgi:hypothetical protein